MKLPIVVLLLAAVAGIQAAAITNPQCKTLGDKCIHKACGTKSGTGYKGYCCLTDDDCIRSCVKNQCTGIKNPKFGNPIPNSCKKDDTSYFGSNVKNGPAGVCCDTDEDCQHKCVNDHCTAAKKVSKKNPKYANPIPNSCKKDDTSYFGSNVKNGPAGVCCDSDEDCQHKCVKDHCTTSS